MGKDWINIRVKTEVSNFDAVRSKIMGWPEEVSHKVYWPRLAQISRDGAATIRKIIVEKDRIDTRVMLKSVGYRNNKRKQGFSSFVGWIHGTPGYSIFQEHGTKNGVIGMNAIGTAQAQMMSEIQAMAKGVYIGSPVGFFDNNNEDN